MALSGAEACEYLASTMYFKNREVPEIDFAEFLKFLEDLKKREDFEDIFGKALKRACEEYEFDCNDSTDEEEDSDSSTDEEDEDCEEDEDGFVPVECWDYEGETYLIASKPNEKNTKLIYDFVSQEKLGIIENYEQENQNIKFDSRGN
jgi:hypothetical protein